MSDGWKTIKDSILYNPDERLDKYYELIIKECETSNL